MQGSEISPEIGTKLRDSGSQFQNSLYFPAYLGTSSRSPFLPLPLVCGAVEIWRACCVFDWRVVELYQSNGGSEGTVAR